MTTTDVDPRLSRDLVDAAETLGMGEVRFLVDAYYAWQKNRIACAHQKRSSDEHDEPHRLVSWAMDYNHVLENQIKRAMDRWTMTQRPGRWARSITGIGPVISAGLLAHIDIEKAPTVGHVWRFAGLDPNVKWLSRAATNRIVRDACEGGVTPEAIASLCKSMGRRPETIIRYMGGKTSCDALASALMRRPWNARIKTLCWKLGESFVKVKGRDSDYYGQVYDERKAIETTRNEAGEYAEQAAAVVQATPTHAQRATYSKGKLPDGHIHMRCERYAVKLFLSHLHHVMYECHYGEAPPKPYIIEHGGHTHFLSPPNWPCE